MREHLHIDPGRIHGGDAPVAEIEELGDGVEPEKLFAVIAAMRAGGKARFFSRQDEVLLERNDSHPFTLPSCRGASHHKVRCVSKHYSRNACSRPCRMFGSVTATSSAKARRRKPRLIGRRTKIDQSPSDRTMARRKYSSSIGPSTRPKRSGAGSQSSLRMA